MQGPNHSPLALEAPPQLPMIEAHAPSTDLVSLSYDRQAWNELRSAFLPGVEQLPHHDGFLTSEQAERINENFDVELHFGIHGFGTEDKPEWLDQHSLTTQLEYEAAQQIIDGLQEGDTLFIENVGFIENPAEPITMQQLSQLETTLAALEAFSPNNIQEAGVKGAVAVLGEFVLRSSVAAKIAQSQQDRAKAEQTRQGYLESVWTYAEALAKAKGVRVRYADYDVYDEIKLQERTGKTLDEIRRKETLEDRYHYYQTIRQRDKAARNTVKDFLLEQLPPEGTPPPTGRKPKVAVLFGKFHKDHMTEMFRDLGLEVTVNELEHSTADERANEHRARQQATNQSNVIEGELVDY